MTNEFNFDVAMQLVESEELFPVDLDQAFIWLGYTRKDTAKDKLTSMFEEDLDYVYVRALPEADNHGTFSPQELGSKSRKEKIYLTIDAFKQMGMILGTARGKEIRKYFLQCEKVAKQITSISPDLTQALLQMQEQLNSIVVSQVRLNQLEAQNEELQTASLAHPGCKEVLDKNADCNYPDDLVLTVKQYVTFKNLGSATFINTLSKRAAQYYRLAKQSDPLTNSRNQVIYRGSDILYLDEALKSILDLD